MIVTSRFFLAVILASSLMLGSCTQSDPVSQDQRSDIIRLFDNPAVAFQARQNALQGRFIKDAAVEVKALRGWPRFSVAAVPEFCQLRLQDGRREPAAELKAGDNVLPFVDHPDQLFNQKTGWTFLRRIVLKRKAIIPIDEEMEMSFRLPNALEQVTLVLPLRNEDMTLDIFAGEGLIHSEKLTGQRHVTLPPKAVPAGKMLLQFQLSATGPKARDCIQVDQIVFGSSDRIVIKGVQRNEEVTFSYFASEPEHYRALKQIFRTDYFPDELFVKSPFYKTQFSDNSGKYQRLMRSMLMVSDNSVSTTVTLADAPMEMRFSYGTDGKQHPSESAISVVIEEQGPEKKSLIGAYPSAELGKKYWHDAVIDLTAFAGETIKVTFSFESDLDDSSEEVSCSIGEPIIIARSRQPDDQRKNVILISLDTLRGDRLSGMGWMRETTPYLDELIQKGLVYSNFYSYTCWTLPSHKTMLTGFHDFYVTYLTGLYNTRPPLTRSMPSAASHFRAAGYQTLAMVDSGFMAGRYGFQRDFDQYWDHKKPWGQDIIIDGQKRRKKHLHWQAAPELLDDLGSKHPFFLFLHTYSPHFPYSTISHEHHWHNPEADDLYKPDLTRRGVVEETQLYVEHVNRVYDRNLHRTDAELKAFFSYLESNGFLKNSIIVITADHGEMLGERPERLAMHADVWEQVLRVPLIILDGDRLAGQRVETRATLRDIVPTLLDLADLPIPEYLPGRSLLQTYRQPTSFVAKHYATDDRTIAFLHGPYKIHLDTQVPLLFNLESDPYELDPLDLSQPRYRDLARELELQAFIHTADYHPGWNVLVPDNTGRLRVRFTGLTKKQIIATKAIGPQLDTFAAFQNMLEAETENRTMLSYLEQRQPGPVSIVVETWDEESGAWQPYRGSYSLFGAKGVAELPAKIMLPEGDDQHQLQALLDAARHGDVVIWYTHAPFLSDGVTNTTSLTEQDEAGLRNLGYLQ